MSLLEDTKITAFLKNEVEQDILKSAYSRIHDYHDPLRGPIFALLTRELLRIVMKRLAPDKDVAAASWCQGEPWTYVDTRDGSTKLTRASRYRFAITGTISDAKLKEHPKLDCTVQIKELKDLVDKLSKFAHISPGTHGLSVTETNDFLHEVEVIMSDYVTKLIETKKHVADIIFHLVDSKLNEHLMEEIPNELDELSSGTRIDGVMVEELEDFDTSSAFLVLSGSGHTDVELNYGGSSDRHSSEQSYPFQFYVQIDPDTFDVSVDSVEVDTADFYE